MKRMFDGLIDDWVDGAMSPQRLVTELIGKVPAEGMSYSAGLVRFEASADAIAQYMEGVRHLCDLGALLPSEVYWVLTAGRGHEPEDPCSWALGKDADRIQAMGEGLMKLREGGYLTDEHMHQLLLSPVDGRHPLHECFVSRPADAKARASALIGLLVRGAIEGYFSPEEAFRTMTDRQYRTRSGVSTEVAFRTATPAVLATLVRNIELLHDLRPEGSEGALTDDLIRQEMRPLLDLAEARHEDQDTRRLVALCRRTWNIP